MSSIQGVLSSATAYIEGIQIPIVSWTTQSGVNGAASAVVGVNPSPGAKRLLPGSHVAIFATDPVRSHTGNQVLDGDVGAEESIDSESQRGLYCVFEGRLIARGYQIHASGMRAVTLSCKGVLLDWEQTKQFWSDPTADPGTMINQLLVNNFSGVEGKWETGGSLQSFILKGLGNGDVKLKCAKPKTEDDEDDETVEVSNFLEHILNIVEHFGNSSAIYSTNRNRFRLTDRVSSIPTGDSLKQLFAVNTFAGFYRGTLQKLSGMSTLMAMVSIILETIHHDVVEVAAPSLVKRAGVDRADNGLAKIDDDSGIFKRKFGQEEWIPTSVIIKPQIIEQAPPSCNVIFPDVRMQLSYERTFVAEPSRQQAMPTMAFFGEGRFNGIKKMQPAVLAAFCNHKIIGNAIGTKKDKGASTPDGEEPEGEHPKLKDWHFVTNEEKFRGIVYNHIQSFPTPGKLARTEANEDLDDMNEYTDLVLRAQFLKSRYQSRSMSCSGPLNLRPVPGFPVLILDDTSAEMHMLGYLLSVTHSQDAQGSDTTSYAIAFPRELSEEDLNSPVRVQAQPADEEDIDTGLGTRTVTVVKGDTLNEIGAKHDLSPSSIAALNPQLLGRAYLKTGESILEDYDPAKHGSAYLTDYNYIIPGDEIIILPLADVQGSAALAEQAKTRHPIATKISEFGVQESLFRTVEQPEVPIWFANPWRERDDVAAGLSRAYRTLLGTPVVACTHSGDNQEFDVSMEPRELPDAVAVLAQNLKDADIGGIRTEFVDRYTRRRMVTPRELFTFMGATNLVAGEIYEGGPFSGATENFPFELEQWGKLLDGVNDLAKKAESDPSAREDPEQGPDIKEAEKVVNQLVAGTLSHPMTFAEVYDARRQRAMNYRLELARRQGFRG